MAASASASAFSTSAATGTVWSFAIIITSFLFSSAFFGENHGNCLKNRAFRQNRAVRLRAGVVRLQSGGVGLRAVGVGMKAGVARLRAGQAWLEAGGIWLQAGVIGREAGGERGKAGRGRLANRRRRPRAGGFRQACPSSHAPTLREGLGQRLSK